MSTFQDIDIDYVSDAIYSVAMEKIVPRFRQLEEGQIRSKTSPSDLVTIADEEAEVDLTRILQSFLPGSLVVGEEAVAQGAITLEALAQSERPVWVIDPVDGTGNFAAGREIFGTIVALVQGGVTTHSWIYQIPDKKMVCAVKDGGIFLNGKKWRKPPISDETIPLNEMRAFISTKFMPPKMRPYIAEKLSLVADSTALICCAYEYVLLAEGKATFSIYRKTKPWDHLGGVLLFQEAGGHTCRWDGTPYEPMDERTGLINAPSAAMARKIFKTFLKEPLALMSSPS